MSLDGDRVVSARRSKVSGLPPVLTISADRVTEALPDNVSLMEEGSNAAAGGVTPSPLRGTSTVGVSGSSLTMRRVPEYAAIAGGENVSSIGMAAPGGTVAEPGDGENTGASDAIDATCSATVPW